MARMSAFVSIGVTTSIPANNTEPTMASGAVVTLTDSGNVLEIEGETDGSGKLIKCGVGDQGWLRALQAGAANDLINAEASDKVA